MRGLQELRLSVQDTFRAGAFDRLKQNAIKAKIPYYGSLTQTDPVVVAAEGVAQFKKERFDIIIVDTSGRHKQEEDLFEEMTARFRMRCDQIRPFSFLIVQSVKPPRRNLRRSKQRQISVHLSSPKPTAHAAGGGAISAVAATHTPIIFLGTGGNT